MAGERSGLWSEYARIIGEVRPRYAIIENVAALLHRPSEELFDFPRWSMMRNGTVFQLPPLVRLADARPRLEKKPRRSQDGRSNGPSGNELGRAVNQSMGRIRPATRLEGYGIGPRGG